MEGAFGWSFIGDASARLVLGTIRSELVNVQGEGAIRALFDLGITTQKMELSKPTTPNLMTH